jgi:hypothetical protein
MSRGEMQVAPEGYNFSVSKNHIVLGWIEIFREDSFLTVFGSSEIRMLNTRSRENCPLKLR